MKIKRNDPCNCGSGKKYKKCCLNKATDSDILNYDWYKMRITENNVVDTLMKYTFRHYGQEAINDAWEEFLVYPSMSELPDIEDENAIYEAAFIPWLLFNWQPDLDTMALVKFGETTIAENYLKNYGHKLSKYERDFIQVNIGTYYSFYSVTHVVAQQSITLNDILRNKEVIVHEKRGTEFLNENQIIMARTVTLNNNSIIIGIYPMSLPVKCQIDFINFKQYYSKGKDFTDEILFEYDMEIRETFIYLVNELLDASPPKLRNTDDEDYVVNDIYFSLACTPQEAFNLLVDMSGLDKNEILQDGIFEQGQLIEIDFQWVKKGNSIHKKWDNTILGHINIKKDKLKISVNSNERAEQARQEIEARLKDKVSYYTTNKPDPDIDNSLQLSQYDDTELPFEVQQIIEEMNKDHWNSWLDTNIPALRNQTPREAAKTKIGRARLEALFAEFYEGNKSFNRPPVDLYFLRKELKML
jgi:hypothetical protein